MKIGSENGKVIRIIIAQEVTKESTCNQKRDFLLKIFNTFR